jgi:hypothetical protein
MVGRRYSVKELRFLRIPEDELDPVIVLSIARHEARILHVGGTKPG